MMRDDGVRFRSLVSGGKKAAVDQADQIDKLAENLHGWMRHASPGLDVNTTLSTPSHLAMSHRPRPKSFSTARLHSRVAPAASASSWASLRLPFRAEPKPRYRTKVASQGKKAGMCTAPPLELIPNAQAASVLREEGVVRLGGVLSPKTAAALREHIMEELGRVCSPDGEAPDHTGAPMDRFSSVLAPVAVASDADAEEGKPFVERRWDFRLRLTPPVRQAVRELFGGAVGEALADVAGADAELFELAALVAAPGADPQPIHSDKFWNRDGCLWTTFVALQPVSREMGPTIFMRGTHTEEAHEEFELEEAFEDESDRMSGTVFIPSVGTAACGLLDIGEATLYDGRLLHGGSANVCDEMSSAAGSPQKCGIGRGMNNEQVRMLFYVTVRRREVDASDLGMEEAHSLWGKYRGRFRLDRLRSLSSTLKPKHPA
eukprot:gnl/TRDRNA2_/TRDRNA2_142721_c0_seq1.p1 gnl/TRDRNA2_/TRDRNA2_142721_c0~~gnl/TRDRNA2_/TRDRNA2_142721_c0_seq1.p1  ORF type:complete len:492 (+),score=78.53 gnl/TRDRNA2_/TRDRNA2_142721_c0_seq1:181-1476(+)